MLWISADPGRGGLGAQNLLPARVEIDPNLGDRRLWRRGVAPLFYGCHCLLRENRVSPQRFYAGNLAIRLDGDLQTHSSADAPLAQDFRIFGSHFLHDLALGFL